VFLLAAWLVLGLQMEEAANIMYKPAEIGDLPDWISERD
jgi:hypothetical protein